MESKTNNQLLEVKEYFEKDSGEILSEQAVLNICLSIIHNNIFEKGWNVKVNVSG